MAITMVLAPFVVTVSAIFLMPARGSEAEKHEVQMGYVGKCVNFAPYQMAKVLRLLPAGKSGADDTFHLVVTESVGNEKALIVPSNAVLSLAATPCDSKNIFERQPD